MCSSNMIAGVWQCFHQKWFLCLSTQGPAKSKFVKNGCVWGAKMLQRGDMQKLPRDAYGGEARFTPVQELKQA